MAYRWAGIYISASPAVITVMVMMVIFAAAKKNNE